MTTELRSPSYRDVQLAGLMKNLRATTKTIPAAKIALERVELRLKFLFRVLETWDASHAERAETLIRLGNIPAANTAASLVFDQDLRASLLRRTFIGGDAGAAERMAEAEALDREVLV